MFREELKKIMNAVVAQEDDAEDVLDFIKERVLYFPQYMEAVSNHMLTIDSASALMAGGVLDADTYQTRVMNADKARNAAHEMAMAAMDQLNRICDSVDLPHICPDNPDRHVRADFAAAVTIELFLEGSGKVKENPDKVDQLMDMLANGFHISTVK